MLSRLLLAGVIVGSTLATPAGRVSRGSERVPELEDVCPKLLVHGVDPALAAQLQCGDVLVLQSHVHSRPNYVAHHGAANECALFYHPDLDYWMLGTPWPEWQAWEARGHSGARPRALLMNRSPAEALEPSGAALAHHIF